MSDLINFCYYYYYCFFFLVDGFCSTGSRKTLGDGCTISDDCSKITCKMDFVDEPITFKLEVTSLPIRKILVLNRKILTIQFVRLLTSFRHNDSKSF